MHRTVEVRAAAPGAGNKPHRRRGVGVDHKQSLATAGARMVAAGVFGPTVAAIDVVTAGRLIYLVRLIWHT